MNSRTCLSIYKPLIRRVNGLWHAYTLRQCDVLLGAKAHRWCGLQNIKITLEACTGDDLDDLASEHFPAGVIRLPGESDVMYRKAILRAFDRTQGNTK